MTAPSREWVTIPVPGKERKQWQIDVTFLMSSWRCIFGQGCQGVLTEPAPELIQGCCSYGAHESEKKVKEHVEKLAKRLGDDEWQFKSVGLKKGVWANAGKDEWRTRLHQDACVFLNRPGFEAGPGLRAAPARAEHAASTSPRPSPRCAGSCRCAPFDRDEEDDSSVTSVLTEFGRDGWGEGGEEFAWWCTEAPEAFTGARARVPVDGDRAAADARRRRVRRDREVLRRPPRRRARCRWRTRPRSRSRSGAPASAGRRPWPSPDGAMPAWATCSTIWPPSSARCRTLVASIDADAWLRPTPARGLGRPRHDRAPRRHRRDGDRDRDRRGRARSTSAARRAASGEDVTYQGVLRGRRRAGADVLAWWESTRGGRARDVPRARSRRAGAVGHRDAPAVVRHRPADGNVGARARRARRARRRSRIDTDRLAHVAWLATRALPYAYTVAGREPPSEPLRVELTLPSGAAWTTGPADAAEPHHRPGRRVLPRVRAPAEACRCRRRAGRGPGRDRRARPSPARSCSRRDPIDAAVLVRRPDARGSTRRRSSRRPPRWSAT